MTKPWVFYQKLPENLQKLNILTNFAPQFSKGAFSSAGLEHLPYKQRVGGSNPSTPTPKLGIRRVFFCAPTPPPQPKKATKN